MDRRVRRVGPDAEQVAVQLHGILGRAKRFYGLRVNSAAEVEKFPRRRSGDIEVFSPEEVWALVRASRPARSFTDWAQAHRTELLTPASW